MLNKDDKIAFERYLSRAIQFGINNGKMPNTLLISSSIWHVYSKELQDALKSKWTVEVTLESCQYKFLISSANKSKGENKMKNDKYELFEKLVGKGTITYARELLKSDVPALEDVDLDRFVEDWNKQNINK